jgi:hypothetical protein
VIGALEAMAERGICLASFLFHLSMDYHGIRCLNRSRVKSNGIQSAHLIVTGAGHVPMMEFAEETAEALKRL